ncbi:hypothetical protein PQE66_gp012 [Bacillus phage PBC2]|uniref:Uncharacterized protein n=1 Tax=Bacillus phage PBC2 TaxID=1675029 RepID=A0A218KBQ8_9CAUD|nr:hypothetical protein PQE66_gp012 [Bacillus phage PBC2]AKQ08327.1 hypothetical protein PBC2_012 [Bacillus phage PBC2]
MKMTLPQKDVRAIEKGMQKYNVNEKGLLEIVNGWIKDNEQDNGTKQFESLLYFKSCIETYIQWHE